MKHADLNEGYGIVINNKGNKRVLFVSGKQVSEHCAVTYNHKENTYSFTVIGTGMAVNMERYKTINSAMGSTTYFYVIKQFEQDIEKEDIKRKAVIARMFYEKLLQQKKFIEDFI